MNSDTGARPPRELTPAFYGCCDRYSSMHGHRLPACLARTFPDVPLTAVIASLQAGVPWRLRFGA